MHSIQSVSQYTQCIRSSLLKLKCWVWNHRCGVPWWGTKQLSFKRNFCINIVNWPYPPAATIDPPVSQGVTFDPSSPCQSQSHFLSSGDFLGRRPLLLLQPPYWPRWDPPKTGPRLLLYCPLFPANFTGSWHALQLKSSLGLFLLVLSHLILHRQFLYYTSNPTCLGICFSKDPNGQKTRQSWWREQQPDLRGLLSCVRMLSLCKCPFRHRRVITSLKHKSDIILFGFRKFSPAVGKSALAEAEGREQLSSLQNPEERWAEYKIVFV